MTHKYKPGTILQYMKKSGGTFKKGQQYLVVPSERFPDSYKFEDVADHGWTMSWVENSKNFIIGKIKSWRVKINDSR